MMGGCIAFLLLSSDIHFPPFLQSRDSIRFTHSAALAGQTGRPPGQRLQQHTAHGRSFDRQHDKNSTRRCQEVYGGSRSFISACFVMLWSGDSVRGVSSFYVGVWGSGGGLKPFHRCIYVTICPGARAGCIGTYAAAEAGRR
jgi:hypothetical protein